MENVKKNCGMCTHSRPDEKTKRVYCGRFPPILVPMSRQHPVTHQVDHMMVSMLPDILKDIVCGEFEFEHGGLEELCKP